MIGSYHPEVLAAATTDDRGVAITATADEIDSLCDGVAAEANHAASHRAQLVLDSAFERLRSVLELPRTRGRSDSVSKSDPVTADAVADGIAAMVGPSRGAQAAHRAIFVEVSRAGLEAHALEQRIRRAAKTNHDKAPLVRALDLNGLLDQAATFARSHPGDGVQVLVVFIETLRGMVLSEDFASLISGVAVGLLAAAKAAHDPRAIRDALRVLISAQVEDPRFRPVAAAIDGARWASGRSRPRWTRSRGSATPLAPSLAAELLIWNEPFLGGTCHNVEHVIAIRTRCLTSLRLAIHIAAG